MFERFGSPCVIAAASVIVLAATPAAAQGTPDAQPTTPPPAGAGASAGGSAGTGLSFGASTEAPPAVSTTTTVTETKTEEKWEAPLAGYNGAFYVRSKDDVFQMFLNGRLQTDFAWPLAAGAYSANLFPTFNIKRIRVESAGCFGETCFSIQPDFGPSGQTGTNQAANTRTSSMIAAAFINHKFHDLAQVMVGVVQTPFGMESRTSTKYKDFLEDGISTKFAVQNATEQGITLWGATDKNMINYEVGAFSGDGAFRTNVDNRFDFMGRVFVRPMAQQKSPISGLQIGVSGKYGERDANKANYDLSSISTANGFALWQGSYTGTAPGGAVTSGLTHIIGAGPQTGFAAELRVPVENFDLTGEFYYANYKTREQYDAILGSKNNERFGQMSGIAYYAQASYWIGKRDIFGEPGFFRIARMKFKKPAEAKPGDKPKGTDTAIRLRIRYDNVTAKYEGNKDSGSVAQRNIAGAPVAFYDGDVKIHALQAGVDYFFSKHVGLRLNYGLYYTPDSAPATPEPGSSAPVATNTQRAAAPGNRLAAGLDDDARRGAHSIHELILRAQVAF